MCANTAQNETSGALGFVWEKWMQYVVFRKICFKQPENLRSAAIFKGSRQGVLQLRPQTKIFNYTFVYTGIVSLATNNAMEASLEL